MSNFNPVKTRVTAYPRFPTQRQSAWG